MTIADKVYRFKIVANYDDGVIGGVGDALDNVKTKFLVCEDSVESNDTNNPNNGYRYLVLRPAYLWNGTSPKFYSGTTDESSGGTPIRPQYSLNDEIDVISAYDDNLHAPYDLTTGLTAGQITSLSTYIQLFNSTSNPIMNIDAIIAGDIKCFFKDLNVDARNRTSGGSSGLLYLPVWL